MKALQYAMVAIITVTGVIAVIFFLELLPFVDVLPEWVSSILPEIDSPASGWLIAGLVGTIVVAALIVGATEKMIERRQDTEEML